MLDLAAEHDAITWLTSRPGDFVTEGLAIASVHPAPGDADRFARALRRAYGFGADRSPSQDVAFAMQQQLLEVALRALSPGVNEPFTALTVVDRLGQGLIALAQRTRPSALRLDDEGRVRVVAAPYTVEELLPAGFEPIALFAGRNPAIGERLLGTLRQLACVARRAEDRLAIRRCAAFVRASAGAQLQHDEHRLSASTATTPRCSRRSTTRLAPPDARGRR